MTSTGSPISSLPSVGAASSIEAQIIATNEPIPLTTEPTMSHVRTRSGSCSNGSGGSSVGSVGSVTRRA